jgi:hypothetical protein
MNEEITEQRAERCVTHSYACDCREYRSQQIKQAAIDLLWYFYEADDRPTEAWPPAETLREAVGISIEDLRKVTE